MDAAPPENQAVGTEGSARGLSEPLLAYLEARGVLLTIEAQEAFAQVLRVLAFATVAAISAFTGWLLLVAGIVSTLVSHSHWTWEKAMAVVGAVHLFIAIVFAVAMRNRLAQIEWFSDTLREFKKDRAWLARQTHKP